MNLNAPITDVPLIGPAYARLLEKLEIKTVEDLLYHFPFRYEDFSNVKKISELTLNETVTVLGQVLNIKNIFTRNGKRLTKAILTDETGNIGCIWFNQHYITRNIKDGDKLSISGRVGKIDNKPAFISPEYELFNDIGHATNDLSKIHTARLVPIYPETRGISSKWLRSRLKTALTTLKEQGIDDFLPPEIIETNSFCPFQTSLSAIHFPNDQKEIVDSQKRFAFEEMFLLNLQSRTRREEWQKKELAQKIIMDEISQQKIKSLIEGLPFKLTKGQVTSLKQIINDITSDKPMNRILQGDVGSGKTIVAAICMYLCALNHKSSILAAPTEILALQHYTTLNRLLGPLKIPVGIVVGSKKNIPENCRVVVGTHALLYSDKVIEDIALVIVDEQHRFGVEQRAILQNLEGGEKFPHLLAMTATPIPRSLALTIYGDLQISTINELPAGRQIVTTWVVPEKKRGSSYGWIKNRIRNEGVQAFVVCPLIEESEVESLQSVKSAKKEFENLQKVFSDFRLALIHGKLKPKEKEEVLQDFRNKKYDILVATPVVEVGIDIPNAAIIIVESAERFGLASLHQLRGRVGRSDIKSYCLLFQSNWSRDSYFRLKCLEKTHNGLKLAELDLKHRGPGDMFGTQQHGVLRLKLADIFNTKLLEEARTEAEKYFPRLKDYPLLAQKLAQKTSSPISPN